MERPTAIRLLHSNFAREVGPTGGMSAVRKLLLLRKRGRDFSLIKILGGWTEKRQILIQKLRDSTILDISAYLSEG